MIGSLLLVELYEENLLKVLLSSPTSTIHVRFDTHLIMRPAVARFDAECWLSHRAL